MHNLEVLDVSGNEMMGGMVDRWFGIGVDGWKVYPGLVSLRYLDIR